MGRNLFWLSDEQWGGLGLICRRMYEVSSELMIVELSAVSCTS